MMKLEQMIGFGLVGNFANHLEQAGEACDFANIEGDEACAPKGLFPFFVPNHSGHLGRFCFDDSAIILPADKSLSIQAEPEIALHCELLYHEVAGQKQVQKVLPKAFCAFNDTSVRNDKNATKLSQKKNFSAGSKGMGDRWIPIDSFDCGGVCDDYTLASFIVQNGAVEAGAVEAYGEASRLTGYSYFYTKLIEWMARKLNTQQDIGVLENLAKMLQIAQYPSEAIFSIGATRYMPKYEHGYLKEGDRVIIITYNHHQYTQQDIIDAIKDENLKDIKNASIVDQIVR
ncbi:MULTISPECIES: DUF5718 family protein [unclassified Helicobacter]|uniref:DUF5718 family protein n=1 Tax=unclassified Helicobacter TaxID=2593540 RepID=UPI001F2146B1|nr:MULTISPECIES: DUF5718 family protein [unclassified Helicobacter]